MVTTTEYAQLSASVYDAGGAGNTNANWIRSNPSSLGNGFYAATFQNTATGEVVIAYRGTNGPFDAVADIQLVAGQVPLQFNDAKVYYQAVADQYGAANVSVTGHSLGGAMASYVAADPTVTTTATAFNAPGIANIVGGDPRSYNTVTNYNALFDPVSNLTSSQIGRVYTVIGSTPSDIPGWFEAFVSFPGILGYLLREHSMVNLADLVAKFAQSQKIVSPIVLDLNGDGLTTTAVGSGTYFDHNANGFAEATGWVNAQDGILVRDLNGNGTIDSGRELFGSETLLANGQHAANGYAALAELDTNQDGQINAQDATAASLKIWKDTNLDGFSSADELFTLADAGVQSIATGSTAANQTDANGNIIKQTGTFTKTDNSTGNSADIWFAVDPTNTIATDWLPETAAVAALPDLQGYGNVRDLHQAILRDTSGHLQDLVQQFVAATDLATRHSLIDQLIYAWVGVENIAPNSRGFISDARQLYVLEAFMGESYTQGYGYNAGTPDTGWNAASFLTGIYKDLSSSLYDQLMSQTHLKPVLDSIGVTWNATTNQFDWDLTNTLALLQDIYTNGDPSNSIGELGGVLKLNGDSGMQVLNTLRAQGDAAASGFAGWLGRIGIDNLVGNDSDNILTGISQGDALYGNKGNDTLDGGAGNDYLQGGEGNDVYLFNLGSGQDGIFDMETAVSSLGNVDTVRFGAGITTSNISITRHDYNIVLSVNGTTDQLTIQNWGGGDIYRIERFEFADGTVWGAANDGVFDVRRVG